MNPWSPDTLENAFQHLVVGIVNDEVTALALAAQFHAGAQAGSEILFQACDVRIRSRLAPGCALAMPVVNQGLGLPQDVEQ